MIETRSTCCYCGVGCGVIISSANGRVTGVRGDPDHPANFGQLCSKGSTLALTMQEPAMAGRARYPELRAHRGQPRQRVGWDLALDQLAERFASTIEAHGPDSVAFYVSGQLLTEDYYVFNKLAKGLIGTSNIDTNSRLCMASAVTGYQQTLGADAPPCCYEDIDHAACLLMAGSNAAWAHPILFRRIEAAKSRNPELKIIVIDPRRTETAEAADLHLPILPGTDVALFQAMLQVMIWEDWIDRTFIETHTAGFVALRTLVREMSPGMASEICGVKPDDIVTAARWFAQSPATLSLYCQGLNQSARGTAKNVTLIGLHLATGQIGKPGAGPFSLTGQPNAMGGREVGGMATALVAHRDLANPEHRDDVMHLWGIDHLPTQRGKTAVEMFEALRTGTIKLIWIACTNPAQSLPDQTAVHAALEGAELVVLQEAYANTETAPFADVLLPATSWAEKDGTVTNAERRITRVRAAIPGPGEARADWRIARDFARRLEARLRPGKPSLFEFESAEDVWNEHREMTRGRDLDITGMSYAKLEQDPMQWPLREGEPFGMQRLYVDGRFATPDGRARFIAERYLPVAEKPDARFPLSLTTIRTRDQWHGMSRTGTLARTFGHGGEPLLEVHADDLARRGMADGALVRLVSKRGPLHCKVVASTRVRSGQVALPMHWGKRFLGGRNVHGVNTLTTAARDPHSHQPELKHAAVRVEAAQLSWRLSAFAWETAPCDLIDALQGLADETAFFSLAPFGRESAGVWVEAANDGVPNEAWLKRLDTLLGLVDVGDGTLLCYADASRGQVRRLRVCADRLRSARLSGDSSAVEAATWLRAWAAEGQSIAPIRRQLLVPQAHAPRGGGVVSPVVCQCFGVSEAAITQALGDCCGAPAVRIAALQTRLQCGTECGSCRPALRALEACTPPCSTKAMENVA
jgi:assimilatory nitrate reductase catalytic subunit